VNADRTEYMVMSRDQNAAQNHIINTDNKSFDRVEQFKYLGTISKQKIPFRRKLKAGRSQKMLAIFWCRIFCLRVYYPKIKRLRYTEL